MVEKTVATTERLRARRTAGMKATRSALSMVGRKVHQWAERKAGSRVP
jgi:phage gp16-like protein